MAIISWPTCAFPTSVEWTPPDPPTQINRSEWTGREQGVILSLAGRWSARVTIEPRKTEDAALDLEAFRVQMRGRLNSARMPATLKPQFPAAFSASVNGSGQTGLSLAITGPAGTILKRGHKLTVGDQLIMNMATVTLDGAGHASLLLSNYLRASPASGAAVEIVNPTCLVKLSNPGTGWTGTYPDMITFAQFDVEETF